MLLLSAVDRTSSNRFKLHPESFNLCIRKNMLAVRTVKHWEVAESPLLDIFTNRLTKTIRKGLGMADPPGEWI